MGTAIYAFYPIRRQIILTLPCLGSTSKGFSRQSGARSTQVCTNLQASLMDFPYANLRVTGTFQQEARNLPRTHSMPVMSPAPPPPPLPRRLPLPPTLAPPIQSSFSLPLPSLATLPPPPQQVPLPPPLQSQPLPRNASPHPGRVTVSSSRTHVASSAQPLHSGSRLPHWARFNAYGSAADDPAVLEILHETAVRPGL